MHLLCLDILCNYNKYIYIHTIYIYIQCDIYPYVCTRLPRMLVTASGYRRWVILVASRGSPFCFLQQGSCLAHEGCTSPKLTIFRDGIPTIKLWVVYDCFTNMICIDCILG